MTNTNFYIQPALILKQSSSNQWIISILLIGKINAIPIWIDKNTSNVKYNAWNLLYQDKLGKNDLYFYQAHISCNLLDKKSTINFNIKYNGESYSQIINLPKIGEMPKLTYFSCLGFSSASIANKFKENKNAMLDKLLSLSAKNKFELCLMGGDQIYSDELFSVSKDFKTWSEKSQKEQIKSKFTQSMNEQAKQCYLNCYMRNWQNASFNKIISSIPSVMMWDDHDIIDGWGSYDKELQNSEIHQGLYKIAELYFCIFQQHRLPSTKLANAICNNIYLKNKSNFYILGNSGILNLDLRSERNYSQIISNDAWIEIFSAVNNILEHNNLKHLFIMSSIPVVHPSFNLLEKMLGILPFRQEIEDDLHDHWSSREHQDERRKLVTQLLNWAITYKCRVTILSGDVHIAANGLIQSNRSSDNKNARSINQITSSGIMHPPPPATVLLSLDSLMNIKGEIDRDISYEMLDMPNLQRKFIPARNFVSICDENAAEVKISWHIENEDYPIIKLIRPVE